MSYPVTGGASPSPSAPCSLAIGHFDGFHLGHRRVIDGAVEQARNGESRSAVMTFHPDPREVLGLGGAYSNCLTPLQDKLELFRQAGSGRCFRREFRFELRCGYTEEFVTDVLVPLGVAHAVVGFDSPSAGGERARPSSLPSLARGCSLSILSQPASGTGSRSAAPMCEMRFSRAMLSLQRSCLPPISVRGVVVHGDARWPHDRTPDG